MACMLSTVHIRVVTHALVEEEEEEEAAPWTVELRWTGGAQAPTFFW